MKTGINPIFCYRILTEKLSKVSLKVPINGTFVYHKSLFIESLHILYIIIDLIFIRYKTVINQRKVGHKFLRKTMSNGEKKLNQEERSQNSVTASVSADHDYNGQNSEINGNILKVEIVLINC